MLLKKVFLFLVLVPVVAAADTPATVKLSPHVRESALSTEVLANNKWLLYIKPFLKRSQVLDKKDEKNMPSIVGFPSDQLTAVKGQIFYAKGPILPSLLTFSVLKPGEPYIDPDTHEILGYSAVYSGSANLVTSGTVCTFKVTDTVEPILAGERLLPAPQTAIDLSFSPKPADQALRGKVIAILHLTNSIAQAGKYGAVVVNIGAVDGVQPGDTFTVSQAGAIISDSSRKKEPPFALPNQKIGEIMVFNVFNRVSFALVTEAKRDIQVKDQIGND